mmetsp:Transcript_8471/g.12313  ORF Transcript_8471/g.12313 Transcript_8471/m.12313 type:complete len:95 (-) Transcript_8471:963-1247(-)
MYDIGVLITCELLPSGTWVPFAFIGRTQNAVSDCFYAIAFGSKKLKMAHDVYHCSTHTSMQVTPYGYIISFCCHLFVCPLLLHLLQQQPKKKNE